MKRYDMLFFSPHFDDVVLSCCGRILQERRAGKSILIATIFSEGGSSADELKYYETRCLEDNAATKFLGVDNIHLGFTDAPFRSKQYHSLPKLVSVPAPGDHELQAAVANKVHELWEKVQPNETFLPLGVGEHIDHRMTYQSWHGLRRSRRLEFYEDRPYVFLRGSIETRLALAGATVHENGYRHKFSHGRERLEPMMDSIQEVSIFKSALSESRPRFKWALELGRRLKMTNLEGPAIQPTFSRSEASDFETVVQAVSIYASQIKGLFADMGNFRKESLAYSNGIDRAAPYTERFWKTVELPS